MAEDRMLSDEVLLALIKKNSGGGGGGTSNYNDLSNQPQINGNTLVGNKSASDLGLVAAETGKGLSSNDYTNEDKAIVEGVPAALANKQDATDNSLQTTDKTVVGAVNELKSGLTNLDNEVNGDAVEYPYADVITIPDAIPANVADCKVKIEPVQDLHGYDHPWVGGAGKNKWKFGDFTNVHQNVPFSLPAGTYTVSKSGPNTGFRFFYDESNSIAVTLDDIDSATFTLSSDCVSVTYSCMTGTATNVQVEEGSTATDYAPYENICPISGHTEASIRRTGANLAFDTISGKNINSNGVIINADFDLKVARITSGVTYTAYTDDNNSVYAFYSDSPASGSTSYNNSRVEAVVSNSCFEFTAPIDGYIAYRTNVGYARTECVESSKNNQYTIALGDTIYGGTVDFDSGVMTVDRKYSTISSVGGFNSGNNWAWNYLNDIKKNSNIRIVCDQLKGVSVSELYQLTDGIAVQDKNIVYKMSTLESSAEAYNTYLAENPLHICYELATPTTIQLTPTQIQLLKGTNTLTASTGQISVTVNGMSGAIGQVQEQVNDTDAALAELAADIAEQLPDAPTTDGAYVLTVTVADGTPTYSWESAT